MNKMRHHTPIHSSRCARAVWQRSLNSRPSCKTCWHSTAICLSMTRSAGISRNMALWELPWKTHVLWPRFSPSQSPIPEATHGGLGLKTGRTHLCCPDAVDPDLLPRQILKNQFLVALPPSLQEV